MTDTITMLRRTLLALLPVLALALGLAASPAGADGFGPSSFTVSSSSTQAGAHPDLTTAFSMNTVDSPNGTNVTGANPPHGPVPVEPLKDVKLALPAGLVGDPTHVPQCDPALFGAGLLGGVSCPDATQVGVAELHIQLGFGNDIQDAFFPVYNLQPSPDQPAAFGFSVVAPNVMIGFRVRTESDGGLTAVISGINQAARIYAQALTLWGVPSDPSHDAQRGTCLATNTTDDGDPSTPLPDTRCPVSTPRVPLMRNPTSCGAAPSVELAVDSWSHPADVVRTTATAPAVTGCDAVPFQPSIALAPDGASADAPTGLDVTVGIDQNRDPDGLGASDLRRAVVTLPEGYAISPAAADGLAACDAAHVGIGGDGPADCPDASKIGSASIVSPILANPLTGPIYLGPSPTPGRYELFVVVEGSGVRLKLPGVIDADARTGRITATFDETPQQPFNTFRLHFDGGDRAVLAAPTTCGAADATATLTPWSGTAPVVTAAALSLGGGACPASLPFAPSLSAGLSDSRAGSNPAFTLTVARDDRTQPLGSITSVTLPPGLTAHVGSTPRCAEPAASSGTCPAATRVGTIAVAAGAGPHPFRLSGTAYLTGGYKGGEFGLSLVVPALAGPYNLGTVVIRSAIDVAQDTRITVRTDPLPQILAGIPLRLRSVGLTLDRAGFMAPPTSCAPSAITANVAAPGGASTTLSQRFAMTGCSKLRFSPRMSIRAIKSTKKAGAGLHVTLTQGDGQAGLRSVGVALPKQIVIGLKRLGKVCTGRQLAALACPAASKVGGASAVTPLLAAPLKGAVYLVQSGSSLPQLVPVLQGSGLTVPLIGTTTFARDRLGTTFGATPDVPIRRFDLDLPHNRRAFLETYSLPCRGTGAIVTFLAQNGAKLVRTVPVTSRCADRRGG